MVYYNAMEHSGEKKLYTYEYNLPTPVNLNQNLEGVRCKVAKVLGERRFDANSDPSIQSVTTLTNSTRKHRKKNKKKNKKKSKLVKKKLIHYRATRFELSPDRPLFSSLKHFTFQPVVLIKSPDSYDAESEWIDLWNSMSAEKRKHDPSSSSSSSHVPKCMERIICHVNREYRNIMAWQHYMHFAFPCWSLFRRFPNAKEHIINVGQTKNWKFKAWHGWIESLHEYFAKAGIRFETDPYPLFVDVDETNANKNKKRETKQTSHDDDYCDWMANTNLNFDGMGFQQPNGTTPYHNPYYFMNPEDLYEFQKVVLGEDYHWGPSMMKMIGSRISNDHDGIAAETKLDDERFRVTILNRDDSSQRQWFYGKDAYRAIDEMWGDVLDVEYVPGYNDYSFEEQAKHMHSTDVIISPHGAQLTNTVFIRPCTVVLELLPSKFYHPKKTALVMEAGGVGYYGYSHGGSPIAETCEQDPDTGKCLYDSWSKWRDIRYLWASPESIVYALPDLIQAGLDCRAQWAATHDNYDEN